ncbi:hypothetical protein GCM10010094_26380 [Streptomyces flaveus]|uniref:Uncharacterized protein n=1 Tax=Streptomyces flaveus TaxID=66370 RepID=A0A917QRN6_9ACTN|nr:hypothetical protein GCM10010094_26380 [Streptomyces flaveus]
MRWQIYKNGHARLIGSGGQRDALADLRGGKRSRRAWETISAALEHSLTSPFRRFPTDEAPQVLDLRGFRVVRGRG